MENKLSSEVYARDMNPQLLRESSGFFGEGLEKLLKKAEKMDVDVVVGKFYMYPFIETDKGDIALVDGKLKKIV